MHQDLVFDEFEAMRRTQAGGQITAIMATAGGRVDLFALSLLSLLLRSGPALARVFVVINGPRHDIVGDHKEQLLKELVAFEGRVSYARLWGHVGHAHCTDMMVPWVFNDHYLLMHDDVIVRDRYWAEMAIAVLGDTPKTVAYQYPNFAGDGALIRQMCGLRDTVMGGEHAGKRVLTLPHPNTAFLVCKTAEMAKLGGRWRGYHVWLPRPMMLSELVRADEMVRYWSDHKLVEDDRLDTSKLYDAVSQDVGAHLLYSAGRGRLDWRLMDPAVVFHVERATWDAPMNTQRRLDGAVDILNDLKAEIARSVYQPLYARYAK